MAAEEGTAVRVVHMPVQDVAHTMKAARLLYSAPSYVLRGPIYIICLITFSGLIYSFINRVDKMVTCRLELKADYTKVQAPKRGTVRQVLVSEGLEIKPYTLLAEIQVVSGPTEDSEEQQIKREIEKIDDDIKTATMSKENKEQRIRDMLAKVADLDNNRKDLAASFEKDRTSNQTMIKNAHEEITIAEGVVKQARVNRDAQRRNVTDALAKTAEAEKRFNESKALLDKKLITIQELRQYEDRWKDLDTAASQADSALKKSDLDVLNAESSLRKAQSKPETLKVEWSQRELKHGNDLADNTARKRELETSIETAKLDTDQALERLKKRREELVEKLKRLGVVNQFGVTYEGDVCRISSTYGGRVTNVYAKPGQLISPGDVLLNIVKDTEPIYADVLVPNRDIGRVKPNQEVKIKYDAFPYQDFGIQSGNISYIGKRPVEGDKDGRYQLKVSLKRMTIVKQKEETALANAEGKVLANEYTGKRADGERVAYPDDTTITAAVKEDLERAGVSTVQTEVKTEQLQLGLQGWAEVKTGSQRLIEIVFTPVSRFFMKEE